MGKGSNIAGLASGIGVSAGGNATELRAIGAGQGRDYAIPLLVAAAIASALLIWLVAKEPALAAGFGAMVIALGGLAIVYRRLFPAELEETDAGPDWTVARAAADATQLAIAITDRAGRLVCASDLFGQWFPGFPTPPGLQLDGMDGDRLAAAGRAAWREGEAKVAGIARGALQLDVDIIRTGRLEDYLLWRFTPVHQENVTDELQRLCDGISGRSLSDAAVMSVLADGEGRVRAANAAFLARATGRTDSAIGGRDLASYMRIDNLGHLYFAREGDHATPLRMLQVPASREVDNTGPVLLLLIDELAAVGPVDTGNALSYIERLLSLLPFGLAMADRDGRLLFLNDSFSRAAGVRDGQKLSYPGDLVVREDQAALSDAVRRFAVGQQMSGDVAVRLRNQPEEPVALSLAGIRGLGEAAVLLSLKDSGEESRLRRQVTQATKMQSIGQLAGGVAHDFNNILTAIIGHCDLMLMRHTPGDIDYDDIQQIKSNSNRAAGLTRQLLAFSRQQTLRPQLVQLPDIVSEVSNLIKRLMGDSVKLEVSHGRGLGPVWADPGQLEQVILNLAVNGRDSMVEKGGGRGTLTIQTYAVRADQVRDLKSEVLPAGNYTALRVSDTGVGIPPENLSKIFEPFFTTKDVGKGTGLGLSTVYGIVKQSGGFIFAESEPGRGASFIIYLPVHDAPVEVAREAKKKAPVRQEVWGTGTILLVEDEDMVRAVAERALARQGYTVITAADGEQGLEEIGRVGHVDLLISDVVMPNMDGPTMVSHIRRSRPNLPVLFMSGYAEEQLRKSISIDNVGFLPKPFSVSQLAEAARDALASSHADAGE